MPKVTHFEIHAQEPERAIKFYSSVFEWDIQKWNGPMEYWLVTAGIDEEDGINGAILRRTTEKPDDKSAVSAYVCTISIDNIEETIKLVLENGGKVTQPSTSIPGIGLLAYCKDTEGNIFGIMQEDPSLGQ